MQDAVTRLPRDDADPTPQSLAWQDLLQTLNLYWFWINLGWKDIVHRYRGSVLGPFWLTLTTAIFITGIGPLYAALFNLDTRLYLPAMALGFVVWGMITGTINDCCRAYIEQGPLMRQIKVPRLMPIFHITWRNIIIFAHNLPIVIGIMIYAKTPPTWELLWLVPGLVLLCVNLMWIGVILAIVAIRYRDVLQIVSSILTVSFFFTPVMWSPKTQPVKAWIVNINPFAALIELVRAPLLGEEMSPPLVLMAIGLAVVGIPLAWMIFVRCRRQIIFWI